MSDDRALDDADQETSAESEPGDSPAAGEQAVAGPIPDNPLGFLPRPDLLAELDQRGDGAPAVRVIFGPAGAGKTQLAADHARAKQAAGWRLVGWVSAGGAATLRDGLAAVADAAGLAAGSMGGDDPGELVRDWLEADGNRCLLVFDDVAEPAAVRPYLPAAGRASVLVTCDGKAVAGLGTAFAVAELSAREAAGLLAGRTGLDDSAGAEAVAAELGHRPLALALAGAMISGQHLGYREYLDRLRAAPGEQSEAEEPAGPPRVTRAVRLSLEAARAADPTGVCGGVLDVISVLSPAGLPRDLLHAAGRAGLLSSRRREAAPAVDQAVDRLAIWSLVTVSLDGQVIAAHRLVTAAVRDGLERHGRLGAVCRSVAMMLETRAHARPELPDRQAGQGIPVQVAALDRAASEVREMDMQLMEILLRLRFLALYFLIELGASEQAIAVGEPLAADLKRAHGEEHLETLNAQNSLAAAYQAAGRAAEAIPLFEQTLVGRERLLGPGHPDVLNSRNNLAAAYQDVGRTSEAVLLFELTLAAREWLLGPDHPSTLNSRGNLAAAYRVAGRMPEAILLFEQTLIGRERILGPGHADTRRSRANLAAAQQTAARVPGEIRPAEPETVGERPSPDPDPDPAPESGPAELDLAPP